jgi:DNA repair photolyase
MLFQRGEIMRIIYEPRGRALEYAPLAVSLYRGCPHGCVYCFAPDSTRMKREDFVRYPRVRGTYHLLEKFEKDCAELAAAKDQREILMSFTCDPYNPLERDTGMTRSAIEMFIEYGLHFTILTKGGYLAERDFDLLAAHPDLCRFGVTLVFNNYQDKKLWEPGTATEIARIATLQTAHQRGIRTWVSLEPVVYPAQTLDLIRQTVDFVDEYRIGKFNHTDDPELERFLASIEYQYPFEDEWRSFVHDAKALLDKTGSRYIFKKDLQPYLQGVKCA